MTRMTRTAYGIAGVAVVAVFLSLGYLSERVQWHPRFPAMVNNGTRVFLPPDATQVSFRFEHYAPDHVNRTYTEVEYHDGVSEVIKYWPTNLRKSSERYHPLPENTAADTPRARLSTAEYDAKGEKFTSHQVFRKDGTMERDGKLERDGRYHSRFFFEDGKTISRDRFFDAAKNFQSERIFTKDGTLLAAITQLPEDKRSVTYYYPTGERRLTYTVSTTGGIEGDFFAPDGQVQSSFTKDYWTIQQVFFDEAGRPSEMDVNVKFSSARQIRTFNHDGTPRMVQRWRIIPAQGDKPEGYLLRSVDDFCKPKQPACRVIDMNKEGQPETVSYPWVNNARVVKHLAADGKVVSAERIDNSGNKTSLAASGVEHLATALITAPAHPDFTLPEMKDDTAPPYVYDYD